MEEALQSPAKVEVTDDDKLWALLCFILPPLAVIALLMEEKVDRPFIRYAAYISLALWVISLVFSMVCIGVLGWFYSVYLGIVAYGGQWVEVPVLTDFVEKQGWASRG